MPRTVYHLGQWQHAFAQVEPAMEGAARQALREHAETVLAASKRLVPVDTGVLRGSGVVVPVAKTGTTLTVVIAYGGPAAPYALAVHERPDMWHDPPTQWKYLEQPMLELAPTFEGRLAAAIQRATR